ncbi:MAG: acyl-[ACP]--phospholipid O-acyltransferase [Sulfurovum sp.]|uniref:acyl-[ACP]--phospholipid O-acyltransferase n=1 Tax=Sulfurovum sp. TaxID=1969726 RepID=UPI002867C3B3|nr:acyl-[ACP]--phospholipid O-acyltransferase [Sulfurovum sp.]MCO4845579.1 acyl-[ACP]--phospholipid O-acyltransferase [Sulfurovum sp.]
MRSLFKIAGFTPYILIIILNAMTDLGHKIILQNTIFKAYEGPELIILTAIVNALILLPFIFLFSPAGFISDKYPKTMVIEYTSMAAIGITTMILLSYTMGWFWFAFVLTFVLAAQSAIYSPAKYGLIKEMTGNEKLAEANALVQAVTIASILAGAVIYSIFFENLLQDASTLPSEILTYIAPVGYLLIGASTVEYLLARRLVKKFKAVDIDESMTFEPKEYKNFSYLKQNLSVIKQNQTIWLSIIGLSILWGVSQVVLAIFGEHLKSTLGITNTITAQGLLSLAGVGMILGSIVAGRVSKNYIETGIIPLGSLGVALSLYMIPSLNSIWSLGTAILSFGFFSGLFIVPLNAMIQFASPHNILGKVLAGNNFMQNVSMFLFLILTAIFGYFEFSSIGLFYIISTIAFIGMVYTFIKLPQSLIRYLVRMIVGMKYSLHVEGLKHIPSDKGILLLGNHVSFLDWAILQMAYPKQIRFVIERAYYEKWYIKPFLDFFGVIPISSKGSKSALTKVTEALNRGETVALFPEGHLSRNGHLGVFQRGFEMATKEVEDAVIVPFYLRGLWEGTFSCASTKMKRNKSKDITVSFSEAIHIHSTASQVKKSVFDLSVQSWKHYAESLPSLQNAWIRSAKNVGNRLCIADSTGVVLNGHRFITGTVLMAASLKPKVKESQNIGLILPTSAAGSLGNMALLTLGKTIVNLNYSSGEESLLHALKVADITKVVASKKFITKLKAKGFDMTNVLQDVDVIYLDEIKEDMSKTKGLFTLMLVKVLPVWLLSLLFIKNTHAHDTAAILFSSGSEGTPKGIELSHTNMMGNIKQTTTLLNPTDDDVMLGTLPIFHSFGLTVTTLLPLIEGIPVASHPDPTDGLGIGKMAAKYEATILFATGTFLRLYTRNRKLIPLMFRHLRMVVAGAEKLPMEIRDEFKKKFGHDIYEGYGATETTPVASCNISDVLMLDSWKPQIGHKIGTVGLPLPGSAFRIVDPESFKILETGEEGMILIGGTQIMKGYIGDPQKTASVIKEIDGIRWYITGDKGRLDEDGFLTIVDRYSRFAKIAGEMVSLGLVENEIVKVLGEEDQISITAIPDEKKGEKLILLLEGEMEVGLLKEKIKALGMNPLFVPSEYFKVDELPKLGTGKSDFKGLKNLALALSDT